MGEKFSDVRKCKAMIRGMHESWPRYTSVIFVQVAKFFLHDWEQKWI